MTWILAVATVMLLGGIATAYRRAERDRCRAAHPTARRPIANPLLAAVNGDTVEAPVTARRRHLRVVGGPPR